MAFPAAVLIKVYVSVLIFKQIQNLSLEAIFFCVDLNIHNNVNNFFIFKM